MKRRRSREERCLAGKAKLFRSAKRRDSGLGASPGFWLNLQKNWELSQVKVRPLKKLELRAA